MLEKIKSIMIEEFGIDESEIDLDASFKDDLGIDSLDLFEMVTSLEEEYGFEVPAEDLANLQTINDILNYMAEHGIED